ncbi:MAG TPA: hypothetical protein DCM08_10255 [Microscillaceae bacterium]|jgi:magnesium-transporting ATPase (P-type)|nr:hypothetical protein [Microscillaceae bacterium]
MKIYFYAQQNEQIGPFSFEEFVQQPLTPQTWVWKQGLPGWIKAGEMQELQTMFVEIPSVPTALPYDPTYKGEPWAVGFSIFCLVSTVISPFIFIAYLEQNKGSLKAFFIAFLWVLIVLPYALMALGLICVVWTMWIAHKQNRNIWLWGALALFLNVIALLAIASQRKLNKPDR